MYLFCCKCYRWYPARCFAACDSGWGEEMMHVDPGTCDGNGVHGTERPYYIQFQRYDRAQNRYVDAVDVWDSIPGACCDLA